MKGMYYKLSTWKRRHSRGQFLESNLPPATYDHHIATFSCTLVSNDSTKKMSDILLLFFLLRYPNITTATKLKGSF